MARGPEGLQLVRGLLEELPGEVFCRRPPPAPFPPPRGEDTSTKSCLLQERPFQGEREGTEVKSSPQRRILQRSSSLNILKNSLTFPLEEKKKKNIPSS